MPYLCTLTSCMRIRSLIKGIVVIWPHALRNQEMVYIFPLSGRTLPNVKTWTFKYFSQTQTYNLMFNKQLEFIIYKIKTFSFFVNPFVVRSTLSR